MSSLPDVSGQIPVIEGDGQPPVGQTYDPGTHTLVENDKLKNVGDINNAIHDAQQWRESQQNGVAELGTYLHDNELSAFEIRRILAEQGQAPAEEPTAEQVQRGQPASEVAEQQGYSKEEFLAAARLERATEMQTERNRNSHEAAMAAENTHMGEAMASLGWGEDKADRSWRVQAPLEALIKQAREQSIHPDRPGRAALINAPYTRAEITTAANELKPHLAAQAQGDLEQQADTQAALNLPGGSLDAGGTGGRPQTPTKDMSRGDLRALAEQRWQAKNPGKKVL